MTFEAFKQAVIRAAAEKGITDYELYYVSSASTEVSAFQREINQFTGSTDGGVCFRCLVDGHMGYASTEELSETMAYSIVRRAMDNAASLETDEQEFLGEGGKAYQSIKRKACDLPSTEAMVKTALAGQEALYGADPAVIDGSETTVFAGTDTISLYNSRGLDLSVTNATYGVISQAVVTDGTEMNNSYEFKVGDPRTVDINELAKTAVEDAKSKLGADTAPTGSYPVVFAPKAMASLLATYASVFSAEAARKGLSMLAGREGEKIASPAVTLVDDPFYPESAKPMPFDAEGTPTFTKELISEGVLTTLLYHLKAAAAAGKESTGNAAKAAYNAAVEIRPFTLYIKPGELTEEELLKKAGSGVYIDSLNGLHAGANVISGDFSLQSGGFLIENGVKTKAVKSFTVAGNFYDLLQSISAVASEVKLRGMGGITAFASPAALAHGLAIAGK